MNRSKRPALQMMNKKKRAAFTILNDKGLHTRPSTELAKCASGYNASIVLLYKDYIVNAKSLLGILILSAARGSKIEVEAEGEDAEQALEAILSLAKNRFHIHY